MSTAADDVDLFVSYASPDRAWATWVDHTLREAGYTTRCEPGDVDGGTSLASLIGAGRPRFGRVVLLWSPHARRRLLLDGARWNDARSIGLVTPVVVGACPLPDALAGSDTIDLTDHHDGDGAAQALIEALTATVPPTTPADRAAGAAAANQATAARYPARDDLVLSPLVPARDASFVGREGELGRLAAGLDGDAGDAVLIRGLAGSGMTALAVEHVHRSLADADIIWWIRADLTETALGDLGELGHQLGWHVEGRSAGDAAELVRLRLASLDRRWLLVIDGVDDPELLARLRPASGNGQVVVTSHGLPEDLADVATVALGRLSDEHATALVHERLPGADPDAVDRLVGRVGGHALALDRSRRGRPATGRG
ncbi:MAG: TIR domain-containing protein, partial [Actinomycetota bacterium]|nr:TIR domain-containing protein [Actinomycetota bacterium]